MPEPENSDFIHVFDNTRAEEDLILTKEVRKIKKRIKENNFNIIIKWETAIENIQLSNLKSQLYNLDICNFEIRDLPVIAIINRIWQGGNTYPAGLLFDRVSGRDPINIAKLIKFIEDGNLLYPIILNIDNNKQISIIDGHHRLALVRALNLATIPVLISKNQIAYL